VSIDIEVMNTASRKARVLQEVERQDLFDDARRLRQERDARSARPNSDRTTSRLRTGNQVIRNLEIPWLVDGVLHRVGLGQLAAAEDAGKSVITIDLALSIANGLPEWAGFPINRHGPVVYVAMEGGPVIESFIAAWLATHPGTDLERFYLLDEEELDLSDPGSVGELDRDLDLEGIAPALIVFDTQLDVTGGTDEMSPALGYLMKRIRAWAVSRECFGLLLHHAPYNEKRGRGSTSQRGKCDVLLFADKTAQTLSVQKVKGRPKPASFRYQIEGAGRVAPGVTGPMVSYEGGGHGLGSLLASSAVQAAIAAEDAAQRDANTRAAILEILVGESQSMLRDRNPTKGWSNSEVAAALGAYASRTADDGGPRDVHTSKRYYSPILDALANEGIICDLTVAWKTGMSRRWALA
jgi:AAA domain